MSQIEVRQCGKDDTNEVLNICYKTGYMGDDLTGRGVFNDKILFGYLFCYYYLQYESWNCFVAVDIEDNNRILGYIIGTLDTRQQQKKFVRKMVGKIVARMLSTSLWKYPESFKNVIYFLKNLDIKNEPSTLYKEYPTHFHINILSEYQSLGIGTMLMDRFENHIDGNHIKGIHLRTSNYNFKAIPFYNKKGYKLLYEKEGAAWPGIKNYKNLIFGKELL